MKTIPCRHCHIRVWVEDVDDRNDTECSNCLGMTHLKEREEALSANPNIQQWARDEITKVIQESAQRMYERAIGHYLALGTNKWGSSESFSATKVLCLEAAEIWYQIEENANGDRQS